MPFLQFTISHMAGNHLANPIGESSKIVPTFTENCREHPLQRHVIRDSIKCTFPLAQRGQITPSGHR
jgi:hypothetical protein